MMTKQAADLFLFESGLALALRCIPMAVRFKLDRCGVKVSLRQWSRFSLPTRRYLAGVSTDSKNEVASCREFLCEAIRNEAHEAPAFLPGAGEVAGDATDVPQVVTDRMRELGLEFLDRQKWRELSPLQRFAVVKLTRAGHENANFLPALKEFGLASA